MHFYNMIAGLWILWLNISKHNRTIFRLKIIIKNLTGLLEKDEEYFLKVFDELAKTL